jgi:hypothetical protein
MAEEKKGIPMTIDVQPLHISAKAHKLEAEEEEETKKEKEEE